LNITVRNQFMTSPCITFIGLNLCKVRIKIFANLLVFKCLSHAIAFAHMMSCLLELAMGDMDCE